MKYGEEKVDSVAQETLSFCNWLHRYIGRDSEVGDLALDVSRDRDFPKEATKEGMLFYLRMSNAHPSAISTFLAAYRGYKSYLDKRYDRMVDLENAQLHKEIERLEQLLKVAYTKKPNVNGLTGLK